MIPLTALSTLLITALVPLAGEVPDPEDVKPGWLGFGVFLLLAAAVVFLAFSFRKQLRKVDFDEGDGAGAAGDGSTGHPDRTDERGGREEGSAGGGEQGGRGV